MYSVASEPGSVPSSIYSAGCRDNDYVTLLHEQAVVGGVCGVCLRAYGSWRDVPLSARATGPSPEQLRRIPRRLCAVAGDNKAVPLLAALRAGTMTDLVVDERTAVRLPQIA